jgi:hypothetical protein
MLNVRVLALFWKYNSNHLVALGCLPSGLVRSITSTELESNPMLSQGTGHSSD